MRISDDSTAALNIDRIAIHLLDYPAWIFDESTLQIVDGNKKALEFCEYSHHEFIGLSIRELWHDEDLSDILDELEIHSSERSFFGSLKHKKKSGEIVSVRVRATRMLNPKSAWVVHLVPKPGGYE